MLKTNYIIAINAIKSNIFRSFLTTLGIIFGVSAVISMLSINESARNEIIDQIKKLGLNNIIIQSGVQDIYNKKNTFSTNDISRNLNKNSSDSEKKNLSKGLNIEDYNVINNLFDDKVITSYELETSIKGIVNGHFTDLSIISTNENYPLINNKKLSLGRFFNNNDNLGFEKVCIISDMIYRKKFISNNPIGEMIKLGNSWYKIIGVFEGNQSIKYSNNTIKSDEDNKFRVYLPLYSYYKREDGAKTMNLDKIIIKFINNNNNIISKASNIIENILKRLHNGVIDYSLIIPKELMEQKKKTQNIFNIVMSTIASISLLVGGIGIMNIMLANVMERRKEIGIRRALGATRKSILLQFLLESGLISSFGGILGVLFSFVLTYSISRYAGWETEITADSIIYSFLVSIIVGIVSGIIPARKAARLKPIDALREQ